MRRAEATDSKVEAAVASVGFYLKPFLDNYGKEAVSMIVDLVPFLGNFKSALDMITGKDVITGVKLGVAGYAISAVALIAPQLKGAKNGDVAIKMVKRFNELMDSTSEASKALFAKIKARKLGITCNSFTASTLVRTIGGLVAIGGLTLGTPVLAYNEATGENGFYPITAVHKHVDPEITYLTIFDPAHVSSLEFITTTPEHPFYVKERSDNAARPKPVGHEDLNSNWVGAGHLKIGDKIKQADGTTGVVANVTTVQQTQEMFNLTVDEAHTFYVGNNGWLVHNAGSVDPKTIFFSQDSASWKFRDGGNLGQLIDGLKSGDIKPGSVEPIRLVEKDGKLFTLDNRRLYAYQQAGKDVPYRMATPEEVAKDSFKFTTKNGGVSIRIRGMPCE